MNKNYNENAVNALYTSNKVASTILKELAAMPRQDETVIDTIENKLIKEKKAVPRRDIVTFFKRLKEFGVGELIVGRKGHPSRFKWEVNSINVGSQNGIGSKPDYRASAVLSADALPIGAPIVLIPHHYQLRPDLSINFHLPSDITTAEAHRLCQFISSLPFTTSSVQAV